MVYVWLLFISKHNICVCTIMTDAVVTFVFRCSNCFFTSLFLIWPQPLKESFDTVENAYICNTCGDGHLPTYLLNTRGWAKIAQFVIKTGNIGKMLASFCQKVTKSDYTNLAFFYNLYNKQNVRTKSCCLDESWSYSIFCNQGQIYRVRGATDQQL